MTRAKGRGCFVRKLVSPGHRGFPDVLIIRDSVVLFIEVKRTIGKRTQMQRLEHLAMTKAGANITVTFGLYEAFAVLDKWFP